MGDVIIKEFQTMHTWAMGGNGFDGTFFFQFQTAMWKTGAELNYGMFGLGSKQLPYNVSVGGQTYPVHCLTSNLWAFEQSWSQCKSDCDHRAQAVATAFGGNISGSGICLDDPPL